MEILMGLLLGSFICIIYRIIETEYTIYKLNKSIKNLKDINNDN